MLQNEPQTEHATAPGQVRITPDELSQAVAAIEQRKEAQAQRLAGTIPIDEAVSSLHLNATPEEIWAEVQAQRDAEAARQAAAHAEATPGPSQRAQFGPTPSQVHPAAPSQRRRRPWQGILAPVVLVWALYTAGIIPHFRHHAGPTPPALTATAAQIADGQQFYCNDAGLVQLSEGKTLSQVRVDPTQQFGNSWTLIKMAGHVYLRAYIAHTASLQPLVGKPLVVVNDDNSGTLDGEKTSQVTLRVDGVPLQISGGDEDYTEITVPQFQPDAFTTISPWR